MTSVVLQGECQSQREIPNSQTPKPKPQTPTVTAETPHGATSAESCFDSCPSGSRFAQRVSRTRRVRLELGVGGWHPGVALPRTGRIGRTREQRIETAPAPGFVDTLRADEHALAARHQA